MNAIENAHIVEIRDLVKFGTTNPQHKPILAADHMMSPRLHVHSRIDVRRLDGEEAGGERRTVDGDSQVR